MATVTFIIPIRHFENIRDHKKHDLNLRQTIASISNQTCSDWSAIIIANHGMKLPALPKGFSVKYVNFDKNNKHDDMTNIEEFRDAVRLDKGSRILTGMLSSPNSKYFMVVDDDDLINCNIVDYVKKKYGIYGWIISDGYMWDDGTKLLYQKNNFNKLCGTSLIIRSDLYNLPNSFDEASDLYIKDMLGSHIRIDSILEKNATPLEKLPFYGAIYRVGHICSHSKNRGIFDFFIKNRFFKKPFVLLKNLVKLRLITKQIKRDFWG